MASFSKSRTLLQFIFVILLLLLLLLLFNNRRNWPANAMYRNSGREKEENGPFESQERDGWTLFKMV